MANVQHSTRGETRSTGAKAATEGLRERVTGGYEQARHSVAEYPTTSVVSAFAIGFGLGIVVGYALAGSSQPTAWYDRAQAERFGRRMLESISGLITESLASRVHS